MVRQNDKFYFYWETKQNPITGWRYETIEQVTGRINFLEKNKKKTK